MISTSDLKRDLRARAKARRSDAFARHGTVAGERLADHGIAFARPAQDAAVSAFLAIGEEIDPLPLLRRLWRDGHTTGLPVMIGKGKPLLFRAWTEGDALAEVMWRIREPLPVAARVTPSVMLVPLLAFDRQGFRLGYGGGFYDRTIAELRSAGLAEGRSCTTIGLAYDELEVDAVPHCDYDEPLDWVLTPSGPIKCGPDRT